MAEWWRTLTPKGGRGNAWARESEAGEMSGAGVAGQAGPRYSGADNEEDSA